MSELSEIKVYLACAKQAANQRNRDKKSCSLERVIESIKDAENALQEHQEKAKKKQVRRGKLK